MQCTHVVQRLSGNKIGLGDASRKSLQAFYEGEWAEKGDKIVKLVLPATADSVSIVGLTPTLNDADGNLHTMSQTEFVYNT